MSMTYGNRIKMTVFGQSHSDAIGVTIEGLPSGIKLDMDFINAFLKRRAPGQNAYSTPRKEEDKPVFISGVVDGKTVGSPVTAIIENKNTKSSDYEKLRNLPRPSHADFTAFIKENGKNDIRGGGSFSGRMTAPLVIAGAIAMQILNEKGIFIGAHIDRIHGIFDDRFSDINVSKTDFFNVQSKSFPVINDEKGREMIDEILKAKAEKDSVGGVIECAVTGLNAGTGEPMFDGLENIISRAIFAIPAVKGIEFGNGFECADLFGSENNDEFTINNKKIETVTNNHGGILGGISSGMSIVFRVAVKPTPSIGRPQKTVNLETMTKETLEIGGRHDPCIVPRAVPVVEAVTAFALLDMIESEQ